MSTIRERLRDEYYQMKKDGLKEGISQGITQGISQGIKETMLKIIENMIKLNTSEEDMMKYLGINQKQLEQLKKELQK